MMRRILLVMSVAALMVAVMVAMAMPAFAAKPTLVFGVECENQEGTQNFSRFSDSVRDFGPINKQTREEGFKGNECKRSIDIEE